ncbi:DEAD/DEAH box helicase [Verrucomicrobiaceae bacterium 5K15]|uniref:DEAD/DEAH box helicase n=1 Tax=Oceaniferula flava TaxID=2800421 RepID=A0AAE2SAH1_9BACT|nr:DEAD/DEAH box helicase [Oceaniferula flavus]MBK1854044.1 DEAD/DEAH box helicase [Oceaniferula flavus]MBM1135350.1 DEAD/DEAH box helicase [Oceaniferula flavus]
MSFQSLGLHDRILQATDDAGYSQPTPIQAKTIPAILSGRDLIGLAQTGTGKTAAFTLPLLSQLVSSNHDLTERAARVLIIAPTRELVQQINQSIRTYGKFTNLRTAIVMGGASEKHQIEKLQSNVDIVIATPGRLMALMKDGHCNFGKLTHLVLDEADRMLDMGFLPDIQAITESLPKRRQSLLFSATFPQQVERLAKTILKDPHTIEVGARSNPAETVDQYLYPVEPHLKTPLLIELLEDHQFFSVIAFVRTREDADLLTKDLRGAGIDTEAIHSDRSQNHRARALRDFKASKLRVLVATDIAARGLDIPNVTHVVNYDFPGQSDDYIHRIGRTGRAGAEGCAITFLTENDGERLKKLERHIGKTLAKRFLDGFNYKVPAPEEEKERRFVKRQPKRHSSDRFENSPRGKARKTAKKTTQKRTDWRKPKKRK